MTITVRAKYSQTMFITPPLARGRLSKTVDSSATNNFIRKAQSGGRSALQLQLSQSVFARLLPISVRSLATLKAAWRQQKPWPADSSNLATHKRFLTR